MNSSNFNRLAEEYKKEKEIKFKNEMQSKIRERLVNSNLPKLASVNEANKLECKICKHESKDPVSFNKHLAIPQHLNAVEALRRKAEEKKQKKNEAKVEIGVKRKPEISFSLQESLEKPGKNSLDEAEEDEDPQTRTEAKVETLNNKEAEEEEEETPDLPEGFFDKPAPKKKAPKQTIQALKKDFDKEMELLLQIAKEEEERNRNSKMIEEPQEQEGGFELSGTDLNEPAGFQMNEADALFTGESEFERTKRMIDELRKKRAEAKKMTKSKLKEERINQAAPNQDADELEEIGDLTTNDWKKRKI